MTAPPVLEGCDVLPPLDRNDSNSKTAISTEKNAHKKKSAATTHSKDRFLQLNAFVDETLRGVGGTAAKVWFILWRDTKPDGLVIVSQANLAIRAGVSIRTVHSALKTLISKGLLIVVRKGRIGSGASTYRVRPVNSL